MRVPILTSPAPLTCEGGGDNAFKACYFNSDQLTNLAASGTEARIDFDWGDGSPAFGVNADQFSASFTGDFDFDGGNHRFTVVADDGVRLYIDGGLVIDQWVEQAPSTYSVNFELAAGKHEIRIEYFERAQGAVLKLFWAASPRPSPLPSPSPSPTIWPASSWEKDSPEAQGMSSSKLSSISSTAVDNAVVIRHGLEVWTWGDPSSRYDNWASVARSYLTAVWGMAIQDGSIPGGLDVLEQRVKDLSSSTAQGFRSDVKLKHLLSYTSCGYPAGSRWSYSCGQDWPDQHRVFEEVTGRTVQDYMEKELFSVLDGGTLRANRTSADETNRVYGSARDHARWGYLWLNRGQWNGRQLVDPTFVSRSINPGPDGNGPNPNEGWQIHLNRDGRVVPGCPEDGFFAYGAEDRAVIFVSPSLDLVVARWTGRHGYPIEDWMGKICQAVVE